MPVERFSPRLWQAVRAGDPAAVLKQARLDAGLSQQELGDRFGSSASTISRFESGRRPLRDVAVLRRLAQVLDLPPEAFGLNSSTATGVSSQDAGGGAPRVEPNPMLREEDDPVRRRAWRDGAAAAITAQVYNLVTRALIKLRASGLEWISADRALRAASQAEDALTLAEAQRLMGSVFRRAGHHARAQTLTLQATDQLGVTSRTAPPEALSLHGVLMCSAGYAAARAGDRDRAADLLTEAQTAAARLPAHPGSTAWVSMTG